MLLFTDHLRHPMRGKVGKRLLGMFQEPRPVLTWSVGAMVGGR